MSLKSHARTRFQLIESQRPLCAYVVPTGLVRVGVCVRFIPIIASEMCPDKDIFLHGCDDSKSAVCSLTFVLSALPQGSMA